MVVLLLCVGLAILTAGAELLVRGAAGLALTLRVSPLVVGLTVVAFGTSAPELVVSAQSALSGQGDIALGNVLGSNIFNVLFILGLSALITPLLVAQQLVRFDVPLMIAVSLAVWAQGADGRIGRMDGFVLCVGLAAYTTWAVISSRREQRAVQDEYAQELGSLAATTAVQVVWQLILVAAGLGMLILGARLFLGASVDLARSFELSELVIGLTLVAAGTSLPEVATSVMAAVRQERDIAVGNVVGSNLFNLLGVLGTSALLSGEGIAVSPQALTFDFPVMAAVAVACLPIFFTGNGVTRWEGGVFLGYYGAYTAYLVLTASGSEWTIPFGRAMMWGAIPLTMAALIWGTAHSLLSRNTGGPKQPVDDAAR